ncbi:IPT/TIG domain-containing protein [Leifsonia sp. NPDC058194]|uniref:IPT/TIG domain-containing protein n=1 Tax=Leifsonia sp. NPDC058194 TaxID=3346374 RepID=UPI0036D9FE01
MVSGLDVGNGARRAHERRRGGGGRRRLLGTAAAGATVALTLAGAGLWAIPAQAALGDTSNATGQYLSGTLIGLNAGLVASLGGETAASTGSADQTNANNLNVGVLGVVNIAAPGGIQIPLDLGGAGVVSQYASALQSGSSVGASGLTSAAGDVGTGITPKPGIAPGPLHVNLAQAVSSLGLPTATLNELAQLDLSLGVTGARAAQAAPAAPTGAYSIAGAGLSFHSATVAGLTGAINSQVTTVQNLVNGLAGANGTLASALSILNIPGVLNTTATVTASNLQGAVAPLLAGDITNPAYPGVTINLGTGTVTVDLSQITGLEGQAPNTNVLSAAVISEIGNRVTGIVGGLITQIQTVLTSTTNALAINLSASVLGLPVVTVNETIGQLLAGNTSGISVAGIAVGIPLTTVLSALLTPLNAIGTAITALGPAVLAPVAGTLVPALNPVLSQVVGLTVNNQSTSGGVFTETALRASVLPGTQALTLNLSSASVGPNALAVPPVIGSLTPTSGPATGGTAVTITGSGFTGTTGVTFGGTAGTGFTVVNDTTITVTTPAHAAGATNVVVNGPNGSSGPGTFTFLAAPTVSSLSPTSGPETGGTAVTITGTGFTGATGATFGGTAGTAFTVVNDTTITTTTPAHAPGAADVVIQSPNGNSAPGTFTFVALPAISSIAPPSGPVTGGTPVTITGTGFTGATGVTFDGTPGVGFSVTGDTTITVASPAHAQGPVNVVVQHPIGNSAPGTFTYLPLPVITGVAPGNGPESGGTAVTITGTGFTGATGVTFGGTPGAGVTVVNDTTITVTTPGHAPGTVDVIVTTPAGPSAPGDFTFDPVVGPPTIGTVAPDHGPETGGTAVTITGSGFADATGVTFGGTAGTAFTVVDANTITVTTPAHTPGAVDVVVQGTDGDSAPGAFTFDPIPAISSVAPASGPEIGGTAVTITGTGFTGATGATFGGDAGTAFTVVNDTTITVTTPAHAPGGVDVVVQHPNGDSQPGDFTFLQLPAITSLAPTSGPETGGTAVTITGTGFTGATGATFGGDAGTAFTVVNDTTITVTTPAHAPGAVDVIVQHPNGDSQPGAFTFLQLPAIASLAPTSGPAAGGTAVTVTGTGFTGATGVTFGGTAGTAFTVVDDTTITVTSPAHVPGAVDVIVQHPNGDSQPGDFTFLPAPAILSLSPTSGPETGGTAVTITGTGFTGATGATFDGTAGTGFTVVNDTTITVTSPAHAPGATDVVVQSPNGASGPGTFTFVALPAIGSLAPASGPVTGGTPVTITGTGFTGATGVTFDGLPGVGFSVTNDTTITVASPAHAAGPVDVIVQAPVGDSAPATFTYVALPSITGVSPANGPETGGTAVTITGTGFTGATAVTFGGTPATGVTVVDDTTITATTPAHAPGAVGVVVTTPVGPSEPGDFTFDAVPAITSVAPADGPETGGTAVTITGTGFTGATGVTFGGTPGTAFTVVNDTTITATTPAHAPGAVNVIVQHPNGDSQPGDFTFVAVPAIASLTPTSGPEAGGTAVTITGTGFTGATGATFGGTAGTAFTVVNDTTITVTTPAHTPGAVDVVVQHPTADSAPGTFTFLAAPAITSVAPDSGPQTGGTAVTITGTGFTGATGVTFGGTAGTAFTVVNDTTITVTTPAGTPGTVGVVVQSPAGDSDPGDFTYLAVPAITSIAPSSGPATGGTVVTITGTGFTGATGVTFGGVDGTGFTVVNDTTITVTTPPGTPGTAEVVVQHPNGDSQPGDFTYLAVPPVIGSIVPDIGPQTGGTHVTITGTGFTGSTAVVFGDVLRTPPLASVASLAAPFAAGTPGTDFTVVNDTTITVTTPAHLPGTYDLVIESPNGDSEPALFTFTPVEGAPTISGIAPDHGPTAGGTPVTISGAGFTGATSVTVDGAEVPFTVVDDGTITIVTPPHAVGAVPIVVTTPVGPTPAATFTYQTGTTIGTVDPGHGPQGGGTTVTITGSCFTGATAVLFGSKPATSFTVVNDTTIAAVTPAGTGTVTVTVTGSAQCGSDTLAGGFRYDDPAATTGGGLADTGSDAGGFSLLGGIALLLIACGAGFLIRRTRRA